MGLGIGLGSGLGAEELGSGLGTGLGSGLGTGLDSRPGMEGLGMELDTEGPPELQTPVH